MRGWLQSICFDSSLSHYNYNRKEMFKETKLGTKMIFSFKLIIMLQSMNLFKHLCYWNSSMVLLSMVAGTTEVYFAKKQTKKGDIF